MGRYLDGKIVLVTGGGRGIGRAVALAAAAQGSKVVVADYGGRVDAIAEGSTGPADQVVEEVRAGGGQAVACYDNIASMAGGRHAVGMALDNFGRLDALVCCAGIAIQKTLLETSEADWDALMAVHLKGHFSCAQAAAQVMTKQQTGRLIFFSSTAFCGAPDQPGYAAAKAGVLGLMWSCALGLAPHGITANAILPDGATRMSDYVYMHRGTLSERVGQTLRSDLAEGTHRDPGNVPPVVLYLISDQAKGVNGQIFAATGYQVTRVARLGYGKTVRSEGPWDIEELFRRFPEEMGTELPAERLAWPPPF